MKKLNLITLLCVALSVFSSSCSSDSIVCDEPTQRSLFKTSLKITPEEASLIADYAINNITDNNTRTARAIQSIYLLKGSKTRGENSILPDSALYLINYSDNQGFALVAADKRLIPFYAVSNSGNLNINDTTSNKGLSQILNQIYCDVNRTLSEAIVDTTGGINWNPGVLPDKPIGSGFDCTERISPLLSPVVTQWGQGFPFNLLCPLDANQNRTKAGCAAIACTQIMSKFNHPDSYNGFTFDWTTMKTQYGNNSLYRFIRILGLPENLNMNYGYSASSASSANVHRTFYNLGYNLPEAYSSYDYYKVKQSLQKGSPVLAIGSNVNNIYEAHAWVIDGMAKYTVTTVGSPLKGVNYYYCHTVWGWNGSGNGYYLYSNTVGDKYLENDKETGDNVTPPSPYIFNNIQIIGSFSIRQ